MKDFAVKFVVAELKTIAVSNKKTFKTFIVYKSLEVFQKSLWKIMSKIDDIILRLVTKAFVIFVTEIL